MTAVPTKSPGRVVLCRVAIGFGVVLLLFLGLVIVALVTAPPDIPAPKVAPRHVSKVSPSVKAADQSIKSVSVDGDTLTVDASIGQAWSDEDYPVGAGQIAQNVAKAIQSGVAERMTGVTDLVISFDAPGLDRLGHESPVPMMIVSFPVTDLKVANLDNLEWAGVLDLADRVMLLSPPGLAAVTAFCVKTPDYAPHFCKKALT